MNADFHYYATFCAAAFAGYSYEECLKICLSAQFVDLCTRTFISRVKGPGNAATSQLQSEMADARTDIFGLQDITRIWASFHFLPRDLYSEVGRGTAQYKEKYHLICGPNGGLLTDTVTLAKDKGTEAAGLAMHVLADTWAHANFAGTPSLVINNVDYHFYERIREDGREIQKKVRFNNNPATKDNPEKSYYTCSLFQASENSVMNLGHGRAGHLPDYSYARYEYMPAWGDYKLTVKDNPGDYMHAFAQMVYALRYLRGDYETFEKDTYDWDAFAPFRQEIQKIFEKRQLDDSEDWKAIGEVLFELPIPDFDLTECVDEYMKATAKKEKEDTFLGRFFHAALAQKSMVTAKIFASGNKLAGYSAEPSVPEIRGIQDVRKLVDRNEVKKP